MRPLIYALSIAAAIGSIAGWLAAGGGGGASSNDDLSWSLSDRPVFGDAERMRLYTALMGTGHFGEAAAAPIGSGEPENESTPLIAASFVKDGEISFSFYGLDESFITAGLGDSLPGGWVIKDASLETVILERNGEIREITVFQHDNPGI